MNQIRRIFPFQPSVSLPKAGMVFAALLVTLGGCKSPFSRTRNDSAGAVGRFGVAHSYVIFYSELTSGGGAFLYPAGENQSFIFNDRSNPISERSIRYSWNGQPVSNPMCTPNPEHNFAGFDLMHTPTQATYSSTPGRDLRAAGYTKVVFYARGSLSTNTYLKVEVAGPGPANNNTCAAVVSPCVKLISGTDPNPASDPACPDKQLTGSWQAYTIPVLPSDLQSVKDFFKATFVFIDPFIGNQQPGQGGVAYFDAISYNP